MWFADTLGVREAEPETKLASRADGKSKARISMSSLNMTKLLSRKYVAKQENADVLLHHYYYSRVFSVWKKEHKAYRDLRAKIKGRILSAVLTNWQRFSVKNKKRNQKVRQIRQKH